MEEATLSIYISNYTTGFKDIIKKDLPKQLVGVEFIELYDGLIVYEYNGNASNIKKIKYLTNSFKVIKSFYGKNLSFPKMVSDSQKIKNIPYIPANSFRVRFSKENQFSSVPKNIVSLAEQHFCRSTRMRIDRVNPKTEFWYIIRRENVGFLAQLLEKRSVTEKKLNKGELRPEFAYLMCCCANIKPGSVVCDPFCGYGAIPKQLIKSFKPSSVFISDIDSDKTFELKKIFKKYNNINIDKADATKLSHINSNTIDAVITDPPWGIYEKIDDISAFYSQMLIEIFRILKTSGCLVCLSAKKEEFKQACDANGILIVNQIDTLVNGKKAAVFICAKQ